jgi:hypothetical protein
MATGYDKRGRIMGQRPKSAIRDDNQKLASLFVLEPPHFGSLSTNPGKN